MTPAIKLLEQLGLAHEVLSYEHDPSAESYGTEAADALGIEPGRVFKTLLAAVDGTDSGSGDELVVAVVSVNTKLALKGLAKAAGGKKAAMADPARAEKATGYVVGGISPLGQRKQLRTFVDSSAASFDEIHVSAGRRGLEVALAPDDLLAATGGELADLAVI